MVSKRVVLAMSGGVDSSASALLLQEQGYEVIGLFMRSGMTDDTACSTDNKTDLPIIQTQSHKQGCCSASDAADARRVADSLGIPFHALNFQDAFGRIMDYFSDEYLAGRTPNPCVQCNNWLKFGKLWDFAQQVDAECIATGHYAQVVERDGQYQLLRGLDRRKDQSYVLFGIDPEIFPHILFPVGGYDKNQIRELARQAGIVTADKKDSQEICFIPDNDYSAFIDGYRGPQETAGEFVSSTGEILGSHDGYQNFTIGQRKGLGVAFGEPRYVLEIQPDSRRVVLGTYDELGRTSLVARNTNWLCDVPESFECSAQIRYQHCEAECRVTKSGADEIEVTFNEPQYGVAPGQAFVCYEGDRVLGGGWIAGND